MERVLLGHGSGGKLSRELIEQVFLPAFGNEVLDRLDDSAVLDFPPGRVAFTTDSYVVTPPFFPGGNIGRLAICGTVNDLAMVGARPLGISAGFILEEGLSFNDLRTVVASMARTAEEANVRIVTGDTKVVNHGAADGIFINTSGVGVVPSGIVVSGSNAQPGDLVLLSGTIGDHGIAILSQREGLAFSTTIESDCAPLNGLVAALLEAAPHTHVLRDPTRGGLAGTLSEVAQQSGACIVIDEAQVPVCDAVLGACEMLGLDPLHVANEGKVVAVVPPQEAEAALAAMRAHRHGRAAALIGVVQAEPRSVVLLRTTLGATRILDVPVGELLPRIC